MNRTVDLKRILLLHLLVAISFFANAQLDSLFKNVDFSGNFDTYYRYSFNETQSATSMIFDHNSFSFGWLSLGLSKEGTKTGFATNVALGPRIQQFFGGGTVPLGNIRDLYAYWNITSKLKSKIGITQPFLGYEEDDAHPNSLYSGSYGYSFLPPASLTGLEFEYEISPSLTALAGVYNSSLARIDFDNTKHLGAQLIYEKGIAELKAGLLAGEEPDSSNTFMAEWIGDFQVAKKFEIGSNIIYHYQAFSNDVIAEWFIITLYGKYQFKENFHAALRGEYVADPDAALFGVFDNGVTSFTFGFNWQIENLHLRPEIRFDNGSNPTFVESNSTKLTPTDGHVMLGVMYNF